MKSQRRKSKPAAIGQLLDEIATGTPLAQRLREARIWEVWKEAVGPQIARQAKPSGFRDGILTVTVASAPWMQQLALLKPQLLAKLNAVLADTLVTDLRFRSGRLDNEGSAPAAARPQRQPTAAEAAAIAAAIADISDPALRQALAELLASQLPEQEAED